MSRAYSTVSTRRLNECFSCWSTTINIGAWLPLIFMSSNGTPNVPLGLQCDHILVPPGHQVCVSTCSVSSALHWIIPTHDETDSKYLKGLIPRTPLIPLQACRHSIGRCIMYSKPTWNHSRFIKLHEYERGNYSGISSARLDR